MSSLSDFGESAISFTATARLAGGPHSRTLEATSYPLLRMVSKSFKSFLSKSKTDIHPEASRSLSFFSVTCTESPASELFFTSFV